MSASNAAHAPAGHEEAHAHAPVSLRGYVIGFLLSALLTAIPFWLVMTNALKSLQATVIAVVIAAVAQILVQTVAFLHVNRRAEGGWMLVAIVFTAVLLLIVIVGSLWIMYHLNGNMMPATTGGEGGAF